MKEKNQKVLNSLESEENNTSQEEKGQELKWMNQKYYQKHFIQI